MRENSLGWDEIMDSVEALQELEAVFRIEIADKEAESMETVGDLFDVILAKQPPGERGKCAGAVAFYRLRRAVGERTLTPASPIEFLNRRGAKRALAQLKDRTGLRLPSPRLARLGQFGCAAAVAGSLALVVCLVALSAGHASMMLVGAALLAVAWGVLATRLDRGLLPRGCETLGGLAKVAAAASYGVLVAQGVRAREAEMWEILTECLAERADMSAAEINRDTTFYAGQKCKAA